MNILKSSLILFSLIITLANAQTSTPHNNTCGGWFRTLKGSISFYVNEEAVDQTNKICIWTIMPNVQHTAFKFSVPEYNLTTSGNCITDALSITSFIDRDSNPSSGMVRKGPYCARVNEDNVNGMMMVVVLRISKTQIWRGFKLEWDKANNAEMIYNHRVTNPKYNWGYFQDYYYAGGTFGNAVESWAYAKDNETANGFKLVMEFSNILFDNHNCSNTDNTNYCVKERSYFGIYNIDQDCRLSNIEILRNSTGAKQPYESSLGFFLLMVGANSTDGGFRFQMDIDVTIPSSFGLIDGNDEVYDDRKRY